MSLIKKIFYHKKISNLLSTSKVHYNDQNYHSAIAFLTKVIELDNKNEKALYLRAKSYLESDKIEEAKEDLLNLEKINPNFNIKLNKLLAKIFLHEGSNKKAIEYADKFIETADDSSTIKYFTARTKFFAGDYEEALKITDLLLPYNCPDSNLFYLRSLILFEQNNFISSLNNIEQAIELDTINESLFSLRGLINIQLLNYEEAIDDFDYALKLNPENTIYYFNKAKLQLKIGDLIAGIESINKAIELEPENKSYLLLRSEINLNAENYKLALNDIELAYNFCNNDKNILKVIVDLKIYLKNFDEAKIRIKELIEIENDNYDNYYKAALIEIRTGNSENAISLFDKAIEIKPDFKDAILKKGIIEFWEANYKEAIDQFDEYLKLVPDDDKVRLYKVNSLLKLKSLNEAVEELSKIDETNRTKEFYLISSNLNLLLNKPINAEKDFDNFIDQNDYDESVYLIKNVLQFENGEIDSTHQLSDFQFTDENKKNTQIFNALLSFEKGQFNTAKYRLSNINNLNLEEKELLKPILEYAERQVS